MRPSRRTTTRARNVVPAARIDDDGTVLTSSILRKRGLRAAQQTQMGIRVGARDAEQVGRAALAQIVDAFLLDRASQPSLFAIAHRLGKQIMAAHGCPFEYDDEAQRYRRECPVLTLHAVFGTSIAWMWEVCCSVCGAEQFACDHVPGESYDGELCGYRSLRLLAIDHIAFTADPDFIHTWITNTQFTADELLRAELIDAAGQTVYCTHCADCEGQPTADDLDPVSRWQRLVAENADKPAPSSTSQ